MSFDFLPDCLEECIDAAGESAGCDEDDVNCICHSDISTSDGSQLMSCIFGGCPIEVIPTLSEFVSLCSSVTASARGSRTATRSTSSSRGSTTTSSRTLATTSSGTSATTSSGTASATSTDASSRTSSSPPKSTSTRDEDRGGNSSSDSGGLSSGAKAGIGVGVSIAVILLMIVAFLLWRRRRQKKSTPASDPALPASHGEGDGVPELSGKPKPFPELGGQAVSELASDPTTDPGHHSAKPTLTHGVVVPGATPDAPDEAVYSSDTHGVWELGTDAPGTQGAVYHSGGGQTPQPRTTNFPYEPIELDPTTTSPYGDTAPRP